MEGAKRGSLRDVPSEDTSVSQLEEWARSPDRGGSVDGSRHAEYIKNVSNAIKQGMISEEGAMNLAQRVKGLAPFILPAIGERKQALGIQQEVGGIVNKYISPGTGGGGDYSVPPTDPREDPKGLVRELASNPGLRGVAKDYSDLYGLDKTAAAQGRGAYRIPVQTPAGIFSFNARAEGDEDVGNYVTDKYGRPVIGSASSPDLQGRLSASKEYGKEIGKEASVAGKTGEAADSISSALGILDKGIYAGTYGEAKKFAAKALPGDKQTVSNTEEFIAHIGNVVIPRMRDLGGSDTEEELRYMRAITGGDLKMEPESIKRILISAERKIQAKQERLRREGKAVGLGEKIDASIPPKPQNQDDKKAKEDRKAREDAAIRALRGGR